MVRTKRSAPRTARVCCLFMAMVGLAGHVAAQAAEGPSTADSVKKLQARFRELRAAADKADLAGRFSPEWLQRADAIARQADEALTAGRFVEASNSFRKALWHLPAFPPLGPDHVVREADDESSEIFCIHHCPEHKPGIMY